MIVICVTFPIIMLLLMEKQKSELFQGGKPTNGIKPRVCKIKCELRKSILLNLIYGFRLSMFT